MKKDIFRFDLDSTALSQEEYMYIVQEVKRISYLKGSRIIFCF